MSFYLFLPEFTGCEPKIVLTVKKTILGSEPENSGKNRLKRKTQQTIS